MKISLSRSGWAACACVLAIAGALLFGRTLAQQEGTSRLPVYAVPPDPTVTVNLPQGVYMHFLLLPLGRMDGALLGHAAFEPQGHRAVFLAIFSGATVNGDWRRLNPVQAFLFDPGTRTLRALPIRGDAHSVAWSSAGRLRVSDDAGDHVLDAGTAAPFALPALRMTAPDDVSLGDVIAQAGYGRVLLARNAAGRFAALQVGARTFRFEGGCADGAYAFIGNYVAWVDRAKGAGASLSRSGAGAFAPPSFAGSSYGDAIVPILPLGHGVYQGSYRSGAAYFAFTFGMQRIVAATRDLVSFSFPRLPADPVYTVGDGLGADDNGRLYFARPEDNQVLYWHNGRYVREALRFPVSNGRTGPLHEAMQIVASQDPLWPPLRPDEDALDAALLAWRIYPVGDALGQQWIASYLGNVMLSDSRGNFTNVEPPRFPFAVLGRTDDGRLWGTAPLSRTFAQRALVGETSALWWSRDGIRWHSAGQLAGDAGAVGLDHNGVWIALTQPWLGRPAIALQRLGDGQANFTGGTYAGEQLFFAGLASGFYLVWGATPGKRLDSQQGTLSAYRVDPSVLAGDVGGTNVFSAQWLQPAQDPSLPAADFTVHDGQAFVQPTLQALQSLGRGRHATLETNVADIQTDPTQVTVVSFEQERAYEIKYAARPYPLASVIVMLQGDQALVQRSLARGQLSFEKSRERWKRNGSGQWSRAAVISHSTSGV